MPSHPPNVAELPLVEGYPDPLRGYGQEKLRRRPGDWQALRRSTLELFQLYEYGVLPDSPPKPTVDVIYRNPHALSDRATLTELAVSTQMPTLSFRLLVATPRTTTPAACLLGLNFTGNNYVVDDPGIAPPATWVEEQHGPGESAVVAPARPGPETIPRSLRTHAWCLPECIERGYAVATVCYGEIVPDQVDLGEERLRSIGRELFPDRSGRTRSGSDAGAIAMWAWALSRAADALGAVRGVDRRRLAVFGHSRLGKAALLAGACDARFRVVIAHQSGTGGAAPFRLAEDAADAESLASIVTTFPHWFCPNLVSFVGEVGRLPIDQHQLIAACAPRPVLLTNAADDRWANPAGQLQTLEAASRVYAALSDAHLRSEEEALPLLVEQLGYAMRLGGHGQTEEDWLSWLAFCDRWL